MALEDEHFYCVQCSVALESYIEVYGRIRRIQHEDTGYWEMHTL